MKAVKKDLPESEKYQKLIAQHFSDEEWQSHEIEKEVPQEISENIQRKINEQILQREEIAEGKRNFSIKLLYVSKYISAACLIWVAGFGLWHFGLKTKTPIAEKQAMKSQAIASPIWKEISNTGEEVRTIMLPDSSVVNLSPNATLKYERLFQQKFRNVYLSGKAYFKVKRNPERPFSVLAGGLKTTALGTSFTINTLASKHRTSVVLHTGKIVIRQTATLADPVYIAKAGSGILFDTKNQVAALIKAPVAKKIAPERSLHREGTAIVMKNIPLEKVLSLLNEAYHVNIGVANTDIANISYTGTVDPSKEQLEQVLNVICLINNLQLSRGPGQEFIIEKSNKQNQ